MTIDFRQLRYFIALADTLHFGRAAARLHISQPPLSRQIAALEDELGVALFKRTSRQVEMTAAGRHFHDQAVRIIEALNTAVRSTQATERGERGVLRVGFTMSAAWGVLPPLVKTYGSAYPDTDVQLSEVLPRELNDALISGKADVGIAFPWQRPPGLEYLPIHAEPLCAVLPAGHPLAQAQEIQIGELANEPFITFPAATAPALHELVIGSCREQGFEPHIRLETHLQQTIVNLVAEGLGVSLVPQSMSKMQLPGAVFRSVADARTVEQGLIWAASNNNPCVKCFLDCARSYRESTCGGS
ncbi:MAG: LysR family transcriptional regulator [Zoogloeaceae bacterium]|nr:LysR family transcriptional regulator [Rhodocyclaceae bacterium]MCP5234118.1 LysR family transcriptional regulator [Zoogloeaceae bacterium]